MFFTNWLFSLLEFHLGRLIPGNKSGKDQNLEYSPASGRI